MYWNMHSSMRISYLCFLCKQKTAYEMRISDWSSDVCSSDLGVLGTLEQGIGATLRRSNAGRRDRTFELVTEVTRSSYDAFNAITGRDRKRVVSGKSVYVRVDLGGLRIIEKK